MTEMKLPEKAALYSMFFQNQLHNDNSVRKKAYTNNNYIDCRKNWKEIFIKYEEDIKQSQEERKKKLEYKNNVNVDPSQLRKKFNNLEVIGRLSEYRETKNLDEAEKLLDECLQIKSGRVLDYYLTIFRQFNDIPLLFEKLLLLKKKHKKFNKTVRNKFICDICCSKALTYDQKLEVFVDLTTKIKNRMKIVLNKHIFLIFLFQNYKNNKYFFKINFRLLKIIFYIYYP